MDSTQLEALKKEILEKLTIEDYNNIYIILKNNNEKIVVTKNKLFIDLTKIKPESLEYIKEMINQK